MAAKDLDDKALDLANAILEEGVTTRTFTFPVRDSNNMVLITVAVRGREDSLVKAVREKRASLNEMSNYGAGARCPMCGR